MWPTCKLARAQYNVADVCYREYEPMESSNKKWSKDELMPKTCTMEELVEKIKLAAPSTFRHLSREEIVKWARNKSIHSFDTSTAVIYTDFAAQIKHRAGVKGTCEAEFSSNLDVAIAIYNPSMRTVTKDSKEIQVRVCKCAVWRAGSDSVAEAPFHIKLMNLMTEWLKKEIGAPVKRLLVFTDRCGKQYSGHRNFCYISEFYSRHKIELWHFMALPSHFKGPHGGFGKAAQKKAL